MVPASRTHDGSATSFRRSLQRVKRTSSTMSHRPSVPAPKASPSGTKIRAIQRKPRLLGGLTSSSVGHMHQRDHQIDAGEGSKAIRGEFGNLSAPLAKTNRQKGGNANHLNKSKYAFGTARPFLSHRRKGIKLGSLFCFPSTRSLRQLIVSHVADLARHHIKVTGATQGAGSGICSRVRRLHGLVSRPLSRFGADGETGSDQALTPPSGFAWSPFRNSAGEEPTPSTGQSGDSYFHALRSPIQAPPRESNCPPHFPPATLPDPRARGWCRASCGRPSSCGRRRSAGTGRN